MTCKRSFLASSSCSMRQNTLFMMKQALWWWIKHCKRVGPALKTRRQTWRELLQKQGLLQSSDIL
jgi:hypothetical protein